MVVVVVVMLLPLMLLSGVEVGDGFTIVVFVSVVVDVIGEAVGDAGLTDSVFCSHAAKRAAPARMQMYLVICL